MSVITFAASYWCLLTVLVGLRTFLKLTRIDIVSGLYLTEDIWGLLFTIFMAVGIVLIVVIVLRFSRKGSEMGEFSPLLRLSAQLAGVFILISAIVFVAGYAFFSPDHGALTIWEIFIGISSVAAGVSMILLSFRNIHPETGKIRMSGLVPIILLIFWQAVLLVHTFLQYTTIMSVSDQFLEVFFMLFNLLFFLFHGRIVTSIRPQAAVKWAPICGLISALFGFVLLIPYIVSGLFHGLPGETFLPANLISICGLSLYNAVFSFVYLRRTVRENP